MSPVRCRDCRGQASLEYVAAIAIVAAVLVVGAVAGPVPAIGAQVAHTVRLGICLVAGDVCRSRDARAAGLDPCTVMQSLRGEDRAMTIASVRFGNHDEWTAARRSDGTVLVTRAHDGTLGFSTGIGAEWSSLGVDVGAEAGLAVRGIRATGWSFPTPAAARAFVTGLPDTAEDEDRWPPDWQSYGGGAEASAAVDVAAAGQVLAGAEASAGLGAGARVGRDGTITVLLDAGVDGPEAFVAGGGTSGPRTGRVSAEYTWDHGGPRTLVLRSASTVTGRLVEWSASLDLHDPRNWAAAKPLIMAKAPWPPAAIRQVRGVLAQARRTGVIERAESAIENHSKHFGAAARLGLEVGLAKEQIAVDQHLVAASAWTRGSGERERFDCAPDAAS
jgi:hypothetical protein